jgi:rhodanese-related sulfurtransferase
VLICQLYKKIFGEDMEYSKEELEQIIKKRDLTSSELETLLEARQEGLVSFKLIDAREVYEFTSSSIKGADLIIPTSMVQQYVGMYEDMKDENVIIYCRTGSRTGYLLGAFHNMGLTNISHLSDGILSYRGEVVANAELPNQL